MDHSLRINVAAPNIVCVCVDEATEGEGSGRLYCRYRKEAVLFASIYRLVKIMDGLMDGIGFPQAAVEQRSYKEKRGAAAPYWKKTFEIETAVSDNSFLYERGKVATFVISVQYRQNATWQGEVLWVEGDRPFFFRSELELLKFMENVHNIPQALVR